MEMSINVANVVLAAIAVNSPRISIASLLNVSAAYQFNPNISNRASIIGRTSPAHFLFYGFGKFNFNKWIGTYKNTQTNTKGMP